MNIENKKYLAQLAQTISYGLTAFPVDTSIDNVDSYYHIKNIQYLLSTIGWGFHTLFAKGTAEPKWMLFDNRFPDTDIKHVIEPIPDGVIISGSRGPNELTKIHTSYGYKISNHGWDPETQSTKRKPNQEPRDLTVEEINELIRLLEPVADTLMLALVGHWQIPHGTDSDETESSEPSESI